MNIKLFNYGKCEKCKCIKNDVRVALCHLLTPDLCEKISDYNVYCFGCRKARSAEDRIIKKGMDLGWCKMEMVMAYFCIHNVEPYVRHSTKTQKINVMNQLIDEFESEDKLKNNILKKYFRDHYRFISEEFIPNLYNRKKLYDETKYFQMCSNGEFQYNKKTYLEKPLILTLLYIYVMQLIKGDRHLVDTKEVYEYIKDHIWSIFDN